MNRELYLGKIKKGEEIKIPYYLSPNDLTTHAICIGMTGSGKTGMCIGLLEEAKILAHILTENGFEVIAINCMAGSASKEDSDLKQLIDMGAGGCNPIMQAGVLNQERTDLNIMMGLCIGHDILFIKNSKADVTPIAVKDRITGHNPLASLYISYSYNKKKFFPKSS